MSPPYRARFEYPDLGVRQALVVPLPDVDPNLEEVPLALLRLLVQPKRGRVRRVRPESLRLIARRHTFGWSVGLRALVEAPNDRDPDLEVERLVRHELVSGGSAHRLVAEAPWHGALIAEEDAAFGWRTLRDPRHVETALATASVTRERHRALMAIECFRLESLEHAYGALDGLDVDPEALDGVSVPLQEVALEALSLDASGRLEQALRQRPALFRALGIALGDRPGAWTYGGELAPPLQRIVDGRKDRDVLAAALEFGLGQEATGPRIARLRGLGSRMGPDTERLAYLAHVLDVDCPDPWIPTAEDGLEHWAFAQCWARHLEVGPEHRRDFERYVARHGSSLGPLLLAHDGREIVSSILAKDVPPRARRLFATRTLPSTFLERELARDYPPWVGDHFLEAIELASASDEGGALRLRRIRTEAELRSIGQRFGNCLAQAFEDVTDDALRGKRVFLAIRWSSGEGLAELHAVGDTWRISQIRGPRNRELPDEVHERVVGLLHAAIAAGSQEQEGRAASTATDEPPAPDANVDFARSGEADNVRVTSNPKDDSRCREAPDPGPTVAPGRLACPSGACAPPTSRSSTSSDVPLAEPGGCTRFARSP